MLKMLIARININNRVISNLIDNIEHEVVVQVRYTDQLSWPTQRGQDWWY